MISKINVMEKNISQEILNEFTSETQNFLS